MANEPQGRQRISSSATRSRPKSAKPLSAMSSNVTLSRQQRLPQLQAAQLGAAPMELEPQLELAPVHGRCSELQRPCGGPARTGAPARLPNEYGHKEWVRRLQNACKIAWFTFTPPKDNVIYLQLARRYF